MKNLLFALSFAIMTSCASLLYDNVRVVDDYTEKMRILKYGFPEIYDLHKNGMVIIDKIFHYTDKNTGEERTHINYHYINNEYNHR